MQELYKEQEFNPTVLDVLCEMSEDSYSGEFFDETMFSIRLEM